VTFKLQQKNCLPQKPFNTAKNIRKNEIKTLGNGGGKYCTFPTLHVFLQRHKKSQLAYTAKKVLQAKTRIVQCYKLNSCHTTYTAVLNQECLGKSSTHEKRTLKKVVICNILFLHSDF